MSTGNAILFVGMLAFFATEHWICGLAIVAFYTIAFAVTKGRSET